VSLLLPLLSLPTKHRPNIRRSCPIIQRLILPTSEYPQLLNPSLSTMGEGFRFFFCTEEEVKACLPDWLYATTPLVTRHNGFEVRYHSY